MAETAMLLSGCIYDDGFRKDFPERASAFRVTVSVQRTSTRPTQVGVESTRE